MNKNLQDIWTIQDLDEDIENILFDYEIKEGGYCAYYKLTNSTDKEETLENKLLFLHILEDHIKVGNIKKVIEEYIKIKKEVA